MSTTVVNLRQAPFDVYIGRAGHGFDGYFGNPVQIGRVCPVCTQVHIARGATLPCFKRYFYGRLAADPHFRARVLALRGRRLGCFCKPQPCHGDVIVAWLASQP